MGPSVPSGNIFVEVVKKLTPRLLAIILILVVLSLAGVIVVALYKGGTVNLKEMTFSAPDSQAGNIDRIKADLNGCRTDLNNTNARLAELELRPTSESFSSCKGSLAASVSLDELKDVIGEFDSRKGAIDRVKFLAINEGDYLALKVNYFFKLFLLEQKIPKYGASISTHYDNEERRNTYKLLQEILQELGFYEGVIDGSQISTKEAVFRFQDAYNKEIKSENGDGDMVDLKLLQPLGHVGYRTLEAFRSWHRKGAA